MLHSHRLCSRIRGSVSTLDAPPRGRDDGAPCRSFPGSSPRSVENISAPGLPSRLRPADETRRISPWQTIVSKSSPMALKRAWQEFRPGSRHKVLHEDPTTGGLTMLSSGTPDTGWALLATQRKERWGHRREVYQPILFDDRTSTRVGHCRGARRRRAGGTR